MYSKLDKFVNLNGNSALVTGATGKLGKIICEILADVNCNLILTDKNKTIRVFF